MSHIHQLPSYTMPDVSARAREDYRQRQYATPPQSRSQQRQAPLSVLPLWLSTHDARQTALGRHSCPSPDWRYLRYGSDNEEYQRGYREGYSEGMREGFQEGYDRQYRWAYDRAFGLGLAQATVVNLQATSDQAYQQGFAEAHQASFENARAAAYQAAFTPAFEAAFASTYAELYPQFEAQHYRAYEEQAFESFYRPVHQQAFQAAERAAFDQAYPSEAKRAYDQGWKAEARDFTERPVRLLEAWRTPTDVDGVELLSVKFRNFSDQPVAGQRVRVAFGALSSRLYHTLPPHSEVTVTGLLRLHGEQPAQAELFGVLDNGTQRLPLGTVLVGAPTAP